MTESDALLESQIKNRLTNGAALGYKSQISGHGHLGRKAGVEVLYLGFTGSNIPENPPSIRFLISALPMVLAFSLALTTATWRGLKMRFRLYWPIVLLIFVNSDCPDGPENSRSETDYLTALRRHL